MPITLPCLAMHLPDQIIVTESVSLGTSRLEHGLVYPNEYSKLGLVSEVVCPHIQNHSLDGLVAT